MTALLQVASRYDLVRRVGGRGSGPERFTEALRGIAIDARDRLYAVGDSGVKVFAPEGQLLRHWALGRPAECVAVDHDLRVWVGELRQVEIFDAEGQLGQTLRDPERLGLVTGIALGQQDVFLADATARWIRRYDREGSFRNDIGAQHRKGGFDIPNGVLDVAVDTQGVVHVNNPGMHRVERYSPEGELLGRFGRFDGQDPEGFPGCCNPTNLAVDNKGRVFVTEKAGPRVKVYGSDGKLITVVADDVFDPNAKNMDVAVDSKGGVYVADTARLEVLVFEPPAPEAAS
jgi:sugar lactone lactonase YvrE